MRCQVCDREVALPFRCSYCQGHFCIEHKLPENHQCPDLPKEKFWYQKEKITKEQVSNAEREARVFGIEGQKPNRAVEQTKHRMIVAICIIVIIVGAIVTSMSYNFGYSIGSDGGYDRGYVDGNSSGYNLGHNEGYNEGFVDGNESGHREGYNNGYIQGVTDGAGRGYNIRDPTYQEVLQFIASDQTDENAYDEESYNCFHFTADVEMNAFEMGYRAGFVYVEFAESAHSAVAFNTTDQGLIFIEPQWDDIVALTIGQSYSEINNYVSPLYDDTIVHYVIVW